MAPSPNPEKGSQHTEPTEVKNLVVTQPDKFQGLLETISLMDKVSERMGEDKSGDLGSGGTGSSSGTQGDQTQSTRAQAIANIPDTPEMREALAKYIQKEIKVLRKQIRKKTFKISKPGTAFARNELYSQIRRLNSLLAELVEASVEVLKRLFIRVFIDKQSI